MNNLFSGSFTRFKEEHDEQNHHRRQSSNGGGGESGVTGGIQMSHTTGVNLDKFFDDVEGIKDELKEIERIHSKLQSSNEETKTIHNAKLIKEIKSRMDSDITLSLKKAKLIKVRLEALDRSNAANRSLPGCGPGSSSDRTRTSVVNGLRKKLKDSMENFNFLREQISSEYKETVKRRYFTVTGSNPDEKTVEDLISTGESENFLQKAIQEQGRGRILDTISEIQERSDAVKEIEKGLMDLHQIFLDMSVLVEAQGEQLDDIESQVNRANSFVRGGTQQLETAKKHQRSTRKWTCYAIIILLVVILVIVLPLVLKMNKNNNSPPSNPTPTPTPTNPTTSSNPPPGQWKFPENGHIKLNCDGASKGNPGQAAIRAVIRDEDGRFVAAAAKTIGTTSSIQAEMHAVLMGIKLVKDLDIQKQIQIEVDNAYIVKSSGKNEGESAWATQHTLEDITREVAGIQNWSINHTLREGNQVADKLANWAIIEQNSDTFRHVERIWVKKPPDCIRWELLSDIVGVTVIRN